jgi:hypothetical protein
MYKDIVISLLGALLLESVFKTTEVREQIAIVMGLAAMLFIFCLFCEIQAEKWREKRRRARIMEQRIAKLRGGITGERRESTGNITDAGADTDATA